MIVFGVDNLTKAATALDQLAAWASQNLPERQQRLVWLQGLGLSYTEMAAHEGATPRTVERQLMRAKKRLREVA